MQKPQMFKFKAALLTMIKQKRAVATIWSMIPVKGPTLGCE